MKQQIWKDIVYGTIDGQELLLDIASLGDRGSPRPATIQLHGGGMVFGDRAFTTDQWYYCKDAGYVAVNVEYRIHSLEDGSNPWPAQLDDVQRCVRWIRANAETYGVDPERIGVIGGSAGGQLAAFLGTRDTRDNSDPALANFSSRVNCVVDLAGSVDSSVPELNPEDTARVASLLGGTIEKPPDEAAYRDFSPITFVDETSSPFLITHGTADMNVSLECARNMAAALQAANIEVIYGQFPGLDHFAMFDWNLVGALSLAFLGRHLQPER